MKSKITIVFIFLLQHFVWAQPPSPFNQLLPIQDSAQTYSIFISGHFHGSSNNTSGFPAKTLLENLDRINNEEVEFIVSLGDLFLDSRNDISNYETSFFSKLKHPLYNVVGNHDVSGNEYFKNYSISPDRKLYFAFKFKNEKYIFLDTEVNDGSIKDEQLEFLKQELDETSVVKRIFIFSHRLPWAEDHPLFKNLFTDNTRSSTPGNFSQEILPLVEKISNSIPVFLVGGSMGNTPAPFFFHKENNITYIATAIRDTPKDAFLKVTISNEQVQFSAFHLPMPPEYYNLEYYHPQEKKANPFNWRLMPLYTKQAVSHRYFWYGIISMVLPLIVVYFLLKRKKRKRSG